MMYRLFWLVLLVLLAGACSTNSPAPTANPVASTVPSAPVSSTVTPTPPVLETQGPVIVASDNAFESPLGMLSPLPTPRAGRQTSTPQPLPPLPLPPTPTPTYAPPPRLPDVRDLHWETLAQADGVLRQLTGLTTDWSDIIPSPDNRWWATDLVEPTATYGGNRAALYIVDGTGDGHWFTDSYNDVLSYHWHDWLPDGQLIWINAGELFVSDPTGENRQQLQTPEAIQEVWSANEVVLARGATKLWRLDLDSLQWEAVTGLESSHPYGGFPNRGSLALSLDGSFAGIIDVADPDRYFAAVWRVPVAFGSSAERIGTVRYTTLEGSMRAPTILNDTYWWIDEACVLLDTRDGSTWSVDALLARYEDGHTLNAPGGQHALMALAQVGGGCHGHIDVSPDRRWLEVDTITDIASLPTISVFLAENPFAGRIVVEDAILAGWRSQPAAAFVLQGDPYAPNRLVQVALSQPGETLLVDDIQESNGLLVNATPNITFVVDRLDESIRLRTFSADGKPLSVLEMPAKGLLRDLRGVTDFSRRRALKALSDSEALLSYNGPQGTGLLHWQVGGE